MVGWLDGAEAGELEHAELEDRLQVAGRDLLRRLSSLHQPSRRVRYEQHPHREGEFGHSANAEAGEATTYTEPEANFVHLRLNRSAA